MNYFLLLLIAYLIMLVACLFVYNGRVLSPSIVFLASMNVMIILAYSTKSMLGFSVSKETCHIFIGGGLFFVITEFIYYFAKNATKHKSVSEKVQKQAIDPIEISDRLLKIYIIILLFSSGLLILSIYLSTSGSLNSRMSEYKNAIIYGNNKPRFRFLLNQLFKINTATTYICGYVLIRNWAIGVKRFKNKHKYIGVIIIYFVYSLFSQGARQPAVELIVFLSLIYFSFVMRNSDKTKVRKAIRRIIIFIPIAAFLFTKTAELVGRRIVKRKTITYIATYFCGGLYAFDLHVDEPARTVLWGQSSFADIYAVLIKLGLVPESANMAYHSFELYGNTLTIFGRWYEDFGTKGVYIMAMITSLFFAWMFYKYIHPSYKIANSELGRIIYCKLLISLVWAGYDDRIRAILSIYHTLTLILICVAYYISIKEKSLKASI